MLTYLKRCYLAKKIGLFFHSVFGDFGVTEIFLFVFPVDYFLQIVRMSH